MPEVLLNQSQAAALAGLSLRHFARILGEAGAPPQVVSADGRSQGIPVAGFRRWLFARFAAELGGGETLNPQAEKARLDKLRADTVELELSRKRGQLLPVDEVSLVWSGQVHTAKSRLMALPTRVSRACLRCKSIREVEALLRDAVYDVLTELASNARCYGLPEGAKPPALAGAEARHHAEELQCEA
jgi:phage terminase Nu1 subunit (DNA packaging protein)